MIPGREASPVALLFRPETLTFIEAERHIVQAEELEEPGAAAQGVALVVGRRPLPSPSPSPRSAPLMLLLLLLLRLRAPGVGGLEKDVAAGCNGVIDEGGWKCMFWCVEPKLPIPLPARSDSPNVGRGHDAGALLLVLHRQILRLEGHIHRQLLPQRLQPPWGRRARPRGCLAARARLLLRGWVKRMMVVESVRGWMLSV
jgi:hypothetical protein